MVTPSALPDPNDIAMVAVSILAIIIAWDAYWLTKQRSDVPILGKQDNGCFAWQSEGSHEVIRQWGNLGSMAAMMALPWGLVQISNTSVTYVIIWDILLALHLISLLVPKRYAITNTHLFADGQRYPWSMLKLSKRQPKRRIMLLRKGWGIFGPLPLGGEQNDLSTARLYIENVLSEEKSENLIFDSNVVESE
ncbi:MAG: hypothetical protein HOE79_02220 [Euryarchaeota archaeon]|jgi:hypothetical protein|nr:hypothetical protein [Euryarchaeota archaeon]